MSSDWPPREGGEQQLEDQKSKRRNQAQRVPLRLYTWRGAASGGARPMGGAPREGHLCVPVKSEVEGKTDMIAYDVPGSLWVLSPGEHCWCCPFLSPGMWRSIWHMAFILKRVCELWPLILSMTGWRVGAVITICILQKRVLKPTGVRCAAHVVSVLSSVPSGRSGLALEATASVSPAILLQGWLPSWPSGTILNLKSLVWKDSAFQRALRRVLGLRWGSGSRLCFYCVEF